MPRLKMLRGPMPGDEFELDEALMTIGRGRKNQIIIQDNEVSRTHCRLVRVLDDYEIHDLGSTNGTFVNGQKVDEGGWLLSGRCLVELGDSITLEYLPTDVATGTSPPLPPVTANSDSKVYYLVIEQESQEKPDIYILDRVTITIGRDTDNDISLDEPEVSRHHMRLVLTSDGYSIEDLNTMNGTSVNGDDIDHQQVLKANDHIGVGTGVNMWYTDDPDSLLASMDGSDHTRVRPPIEDVDMDDATREKAEPFEAMKTDISIQIGHGLEHGDLEKSVFLIYERIEWVKIGRHIYSYLENNNLNTFTQQYLTPGTNAWDASFEQALAECPCLLAIISERSIEDDSLIRAIRHFVAREKPVLLMQYGRVEKMPMGIRNIPVVRFDPKNPEKTFRILLAELRRIGL